MLPKLPANLVSTPARAAPQEVAEAAGASLALCLCRPAPGLRGEQPAVASFAATDYLGQEKWKNQPTQKEATVPKAKETHQARDGWLMGNFQYPKPFLSLPGAPGPSSCRARKSLTGTKPPPKPGLCSIFFLILTCLKTITGSGVLTHQSYLQNSWLETCCLSAVRTLQSETMS